MNQDFRVFQNLGMNRNVSHFNVISGEWKMIKNADIDKIGRIRKRAGYEKFLNAPDASEILSLIPFNLNGAKKVIMINAAGKLYSANTNGTTWGTAILTGLSTTARWGYCTMANAAGTNYLLIGNGATIKKTSDGVTFTDVSGCPLAKYFAVLFQRVHAAGVTASPSTLFWSGTGDVEDWDTVESDSSSTDIEVGNKGAIKGLRETNDRLVVYKERMMKRWDTEYMKKIMSSWGVEAPYSLAEIDGQIFGYDREAIRMYNGDYPIPVSFYIQDLIEGMVNTSAELERRFGFTYRDRYYLNAGTITVDEEVITNAMIVYDHQKNMFVLYSFADQMTSGCKVIDTSSDEIIIFGDVNGQCYKMFTGDVDNDTNIEMELESHVFYPQGIETEIEPQELHIASENPCVMKVALSADFSKDIEAEGEVEKEAQDIKVDEIGLCRGLKLHITHGTKGRPVFNGFSLDYTVGQR